MKKILSLLALLTLLASPVFASVGINVNGTTIGTAGNLYVNCNSGGSPYIDGFNYSATCSTSLVADGTYNGGYVSLGTIDAGIALTSAYIQKAISNLGTTTDTLPNGIPNQIVTFSITTVTGGGSWTLSPTTATGWTGLVFNTSGQVATLLYVNSSVGWIIVSADGSASSPAPTIQLGNN